MLCFCGSIRNGPKLVPSDRCKGVQLLNASNYILEHLEQLDSKEVFVALLALLAVNRFLTS